ncbi:MAG: hypothetical protein ACE5E6_00720 [Phycisphaerae bacterium]
MSNPSNAVKFKAGRVMKLRLDESPSVVDAATGLPLEASAHRPKRRASSGRASR